MKILVNFNKNIATPKQVKSFKVFDLGVVTTTINDLLDSATIEIDDQTLPVIKLTDNSLEKYYLINDIGLTHGLAYPYYTDDFMKEITIEDLILINTSGGEENIQSDWNQINILADDFIKNKPELFSGDYNDLINTPALVTNHSELNLDDGTNPHGTTKYDVDLGNVDNTSDSNKPISIATQAALDTKENSANKSTTTTLGTSDVLFPTQNAVKTYVDAQVASATIADADASTKGKIQLAGDLGGTADAPTVPALSGKIGGSGTDDYVPRFNGTNAIENSQIFDNGTNVGIGTTSPASKLHIEGTTTGHVLSLKSNKPGIGGTILDCNDSDNNILFRAYGNVLSSNYSVSLGDASFNGLPLLQVNSSSAFFGDTNVGIGTTNPIYNLDLLSSNPRFRISDPSTGSVLIDMQGGAGSFYVGSDNSTGSLFGGSPYAATLYRSGYYPISMWTNNSERFRINGNGNVGIGTTSPQARLDVIAQGVLDTDIVLRVRNSTDTANLLQINGQGTLSLGLQSSAPTGIEGAIYYDSTTKKHYGFDGTTWNPLY